MRREDLRRRLTRAEPFPITPIASPSRGRTRASCVSKTTHSSPTRPVPLQTRMHRTKSLQGVTCSPFSQPSNQALFPESDVLHLPVKFEPQLSDLGGDPFSDYNCPLPGEANDASYYSPGSPMSSFFSFQEAASEQGHDDKKNGGYAKDENALPGKLPIAPMTALFPISHESANSSPSLSPVKAALSPRPLSIASLNLDSGIDASIENTGITLEDIAAYMEGPDPEDNKWVCTYNGCRRRFGRKENIKSHIQTHLGDRQFKCNHCNKCFVRGHDLKRHAKIHTGVRSYPCECGSTFARHDALTRHKQRGMCSGAFEGAVRRVRRGRPRKGAEKPDKSAKGKKSAKPQPPTDPTASQFPCTSLASPLSTSFDTSSVRTASPVKELELFSDDSIGLPPDVFTFTPPASPGHSPRKLSSPSRSYQEGYSCLSSPTRRPLDDIPEEVSEIPSLTLKSPTAVKGKESINPPAQFLWPSAVESTLVGDTPNQDFDVFTNHGNFDLNNFPPLETPSSTPGLPENGNSTEYRDNLFFNHGHQDDADFFSNTFSHALDDHRHGFLDKFHTEISSGAIR